MPFRTWADRRKHTQLRKLQQRPSLPDGTKLITCPLPRNSNNGESSVGRNYRKGLLYLLLRTNSMTNIVVICH